MKDECFLSILSSKGYRSIRSDLGHYLSSEMMAVKPERSLWSFTPSIKCILEFVQGSFIVATGKLLRYIVVCLLSMTLETFGSYITR